MQIQSLNKIIFFFIFFFTIAQIANSQIDRAEIEKADLLFKNNHLLEAEKIYNQNLESNKPAQKQILLKLAFIAKEKNNWLDELYFLSSYQSQKASWAISKRMNEIAEKRKLKGYDLDIWARLQWFYFNYYGYIISILIFPAILMGLSLFLKKIQNQSFSKNQVGIFLIYLIILLAINNFPSFISQGLCANTKTYARNFASSAAPVVQILPKGTHINYIFKRGDWVPCLIEGEIGYIKTKDLLFID